MNSRPSLVSFLALIAINVSCSDSNDSEQDYADEMSQFEAETAARSLNVPIVSARSYLGGSAKVTVTGSFEINEVIPINTAASFSDGEMTWLQYGASGSEAPNALLTISPDEVGLNVGRGKPTATAGADICTGGLQVTANSIKGQYKCPDVTSYDPRSGKMSKVNIQIDLTAIS
jgi:hypothetical protein